MDIKIKQVNKYDITIDGKEYTGFTKDSEWEGLVKFTGPEGGIIIDANKSEFKNLFSLLFDPAIDSDKEATDFKVLKMSDNLIPQQDK